MVESLVALRDRRQQVIARLSECFATDVLEVDELERRLDLAHAARTVAELDQLVADLGPATSMALVPVATTAIDDPHRAASKKLRVIFGNVERRGSWSVPRKLDLRVLFGNAELDLREASLAPGVTTIDVRVTMGNLELIVPPDLSIDVDVSSFMGSVEDRHRVPPDPDPARPVLRIVGAVRLGNLELETRLAGESRREARKRERLERKARRALPAGRE
jgi:hypothetical protein